MKHIFLKKHPLNLQEDIVLQEAQLGSLAKDQQGRDVLCPPLRQRHFNLKIGEL